MSTTITDTYGDTLEIEYDTTGNEDDTFEIKALDGETSNYLFNREQATEFRDALNEFLQPVFDWGSDIGPNEAKLRLAAQYGLKVKFAYAGERDYRAVERRLVPEEVYVNHDHVLVGGESFDQGGVSEGYRQFRLDRISGEVVVR